jgi:hypothetical protein
MHGPMGRPPTHPKRLLLAVSEEFLARLDAWRAAQPGISPNRSDASGRDRHDGYEPPQAVAT